MCFNSSCWWKEKDVRKIFFKQEFEEESLPSTLLTWILHFTSQNFSVNKGNKISPKLYTNYISEV